MEIICSVCGKMKDENEKFQDLIEGLKKKGYKPSEKIKELFEKSKADGRSFKEMQDDCGDLAYSLKTELGIDLSHGLCPNCHKRIYGIKKANCVLRKISKNLNS